MLEEEQARARILATVHPGNAEWLALGEALGRFAAEDRRAEIAVPGFDNSAMDGYAVRAEDAAVAGARLRLVEGGQPAGPALGYEVTRGRALRIFTGAPMPAGADAVIMQEDVTVLPGGAEIVVDVPVGPGDYVRLAGSDLCAGQVVLRAGERLTAARCGLLASQGWSSVPVVRLPSVTVVTTGNELLPVGGGSRPGPGELFNSNGPMLAAMVRETCGREIKVVHRHAPDERKALEAVLGEAIGAGRVVIVSGGVSVGDHDLVRPALSRLEVDGEFWRVRVKPGKPFYFGRHAGGSPVFGLPGNPVSSFVTFVLFVAPALRRMTGAAPGACPPPRVACRLDPEAEALANPGDRPHYVRGRLDAETGCFVPLGIQQSHALFGLSQSSGLLRVEAEAVLAPGAWGRAIPL